jgi:hypothetical protein
MPFQSVQKNWLLVRVGALAVCAAVLCYARRVNWTRVAVLKRAAQQLAALPAVVRVEVEAYLENLDYLLSTTPPDQVNMLFERAEEGGFVARLAAARIFFSLDGDSRRALIQGIDRPPSP